MCGLRWGRWAPRRWPWGWAPPAPEPLILWAGSVPHLPAQWHVTAQGRLELANAPSPALRALQGHALVGVSALTRLSAPGRRLVRGFRARHYLRLRTKVSLLFGLFALVAGVSVAAVAYTFARSSLLDQRAAEARQSAINNATRVLGRLETTDQGDMYEYLQGLVSGGGLVIVPGSARSVPTPPPSSPG